MANIKQLYFLRVLLVGTLVLAFFIFRPFIYVLFLAIVFAVVFHPIQQRLVSYTRDRHGLAAALTVLIIIIFIFAPLAFLGIQIFQEARQLYGYLSGVGQDGILNSFNGQLDNLNKVFPALGELTSNIDQYLKQGLNWLLQHLGSVFSNIAKLILSFFIFLFVLYYLLKDGQKLKKAMISLSPLADVDDEKIFHQLGQAINVVMKGNILIALVQGVLTAVGFMIFGVPNPILWGSVAAIAALIPSIGTALVLAPAMLFLFFTSDLFHTVGLLIWGVIAVGLVDNFLGPKFVGSGTRIHPLVILLSVLGGVAFFGPIGFLMGPLTISLFMAVLNVYFSLAKD